MQALLLSMLLLAQDQPPDLAPSSASASVYAPWSHGPRTDPNWFPIGVWLQDPKLAERYKSLGINTYVGLWQGPTSEQLAQLAKAEMDVVCSMNQLALEVAKDSTIIAWMQQDEPDNLGTPPAQLQAAYGRLVARDGTRPVFLNLGQGVGNDAWKGRRSPREWYPEYARAADILSFDLYPVTNIGREDGEQFLWWLAKGLGRLDAWGQGTKPLWNLIECTRVRQVKKQPSPAQVESEVWISLVNGSRGIVYFCHNFEPKTEAAALLADREMCRAIAAINARVLRSAPLLNAPSLPAGVRVTSSDPEAAVACMQKRLGDWTYLFCVGMRNRSTRASFVDLGQAAGVEIEVLDEQRSLSWQAGGFEDDFKPYAVHIYRYKH